MASNTRAGPSDAGKALVTAACQRFIDELLKPRFLPAIRPTQFNYPVDIRGKWHGSRYRFVQRYRSGFRRTWAKSSTPPSPVSTGWAMTASTSSGIATRVPGSASIAVSL
jgi:hypothetical protein